MPRPTCISALCVLLLMAGGITLATAQPPQSFSQRTGQDAASYAPDLPVDFTHLRLDLQFDDLGQRSFRGESTLRLRARHEAVRSLDLDAMDMQIVEITATVGADQEGNPRSIPVHFDYDQQVIRLRFDEALPVDQDVEIAVTYGVDSPVDGIYWALPDDDYPDRPTAVHTQGETEMARFWYPCADYPNDRLTVETVVTVPEGFTAISNGGLLSAETRGGRTTYHYRQDRPHVFYLNSLVIGQFDTVQEEWRGRPVEYHVPRGRANDAKRTFGNTPRMLDYFSELLDEEYPYEKYSQANVPLFDFGGMENTSATTLHDRAILDERATLDQDLERLIAHELAHQWFGDFITCHGWKHIWLNEGFATFFASMWREELDGRDDYLYEFWTRMQTVCELDKTTSERGIYFPDYEFTFDPFFHKGGLAYSKGSCVLQMLRHKLGETLFWRGIRLYVDEYAETQVETDDFRRVMEAVSGRSLEQFFQQWIYRPGTPELRVEFQWDDARGLATIDIWQEQHIDRKTPAFALDLDLVLEVDGELVQETVVMDGRHLSVQRALATRPSLFCVDPHAGVTMELTVTKPRDLWLAQLAAGPTTISRIVAARHLARQPRDDVADALERVLRDPRQHWSVRDEAARALGDLDTARGRDALLGVAADGPVVAHPKVRRAVVRSLAGYDDAQVGATLARFARRDPSYAVEAEATRGLGKIESYDARDLLLANTGKESYGDQIRVAAIDALVERGDEEAYSVARRYAAYGNHFRLRPDAIRALGRLGRDDKDQRRKIREYLIVTLHDPQPRSARAAISALGDIGDEKSTEALMAFAQRLGPERGRALARQTAARVDRERHLDDDGTRDQLRELRELVDALRKDLDKSLE